jgi:glycosyltransferase involved in cell wall biosynthesis
MNSVESTTEQGSTVMQETIASTTSAASGSQPLAKGRDHLRGKSVGLVVLSSYPHDPRPRRMADAMVQQGMAVDYICQADGNAPRRERHNGIEVFRIPIEHRRASKLAYAYEYSACILASAAILLRRSLRHRYDLIYINNMPDVLVTSALLPKMLGAKVILDLHDPMPELMTTIFGVAPNSSTIRTIKWFEKWSMARAHQVLTVNIACQKIFAARSCPLKKIGVVMNSPDEKIFPFKPARSWPIYKPGLGRPFIVMYHGSLVERNGVDLAVAAIAKLRESMPHVQLHIYGKTTPFLEQVMQTVRENGLEQNVLALGRRSLEGIVEAIRNCDLGVIPNQRNTFTDINTPTRIFEYLALGKPVVAPCTRGITDYFDNDSLLFFDSGNADDLAAQIKFAATNPTRMADIAERGQNVYDEHRWERERENMINLVSNLLTEKRGN